MIERFERFSHAIAEVSHSWHKIAADEMEKYGLKGPHAVYLTALYHCPEGITAAKLSELSGKDKADVSRMVYILEKKEMVRREATGENLYRARIVLTEQGREAAEHVRARAAIAVEHGSGGVSDAEREVFYRVLETIAGNLNSLSRDGLPTK